MLLRVRIRINISFLLFQVLLYRSQQETVLERWVANLVAIRQLFGFESRYKNQ
jgi:hypothetical protein